MSFLRQTSFILFFLLLLDASCGHFLNRGYGLEPIRRETSVIAGHKQRIPFCSGTNGKAVSNASNIQTVLRNIIDSGMMAVPSAAYSSTPESQPPKKPSASDSERSPLYVSPYMRKQPMKMDLSHSTLNIGEGSFDQYPSSIVGYGSLGELKPAATSLDELSENAQQFPTIQTVLLHNQEAILVDTPLSLSVLAFRHSLLSKGLLRDVSSLTGWRLQFNGVTLDDAAPLHTLSLPPGALICTISVHDSHEIVFAPPSFDGINAAIVPPVNNAIYFRSIERSKVSPTQPAAEIPESTFASELAQPRGPEVKEAEYDYFPILHRPGYYMVPSHFDMASKSQTEVASLEGFTVGHEGVGEICWEGVTDACYLNLDHRVVIEKDLHGVPYVQLYPPELYLRPMPPMGCELNKRAVVRLFNMYPMTLRSDEGMARYEEMLRRMVESMGGKWIGYNRENAILEFRVEHFLPV